MTPFIIIFKLSLICKKQRKNKKAPPKRGSFATGRPAWRENRYPRQQSCRRLTLLLEEIEGISKYTDLVGDQRNKRTIAPTLAHRPSGQGYALTPLLYPRRNRFLCPRRLNNLHSSFPLFNAIFNMQEKNKNEKAPEKAFWPS